MIDPPILKSFSLVAAERVLCQEALDLTGSLQGAAEMLGIDRHALKRRLIKHNIEHNTSHGGHRPRGRKS